MITQTDTAYVIDQVPDTAATVISNPSVTGRTREVVRATGHLRSGQGEWGVWCRGSDAQGSSRYSFLITHSGHVGIFATHAAADAGTATQTATQTGTGWWGLQGVTLDDDIHLEARCFDADGLIVLTMLVNGREVLEYRPTETVLGPGFAGLEVQPFLDVTGPAAEVEITHFEDLDSA